MFTSTLVATALFGLIIGSFLNVVILRFNTGKSISRGRSYCFSCNTVLHVRELIPVISFFLQRGRCRHCKARISWQYVVVELSTAVTALVLFLSHGFSLETVILFLVACLLIVIVVYDIRHTIIPDEFVYTFIISAFVYQTALAGTVTGVLSWLGSIDFVTGPILFLFFASFWYFSKGTWMGLGDAKLALGIGWLLGAHLGFSAIILAFWTGALWGVCALFLRRKSLTMKSEIPFAPFLVLGLVLAAVLQISIVPLFSMSY